jgi:hypothetical protein
MGVVDWVLIAIVAVGVVAGLFGVDRYRGSRKKAGSDTAAQPTDEVFVDSDTGKRMRVWYDPKTGQREYRPE